MPRNFMVIALALCCQPVFADEAPLQGLPLEQEAALLQSAETTGAIIYLHDHAAAVATDAALKLKAFKKDKRIGGWITELRQGRINVTFVDRTPAALYRIEVSENGVAGPVIALDSPAPLSEYEQGAATARAAAMASDIQPCSSRYNSVVLPSSATADGNWMVYLLPATTKSSVVPLGGTYRMEVSGSTVTAQRGFTRTCITLQNSPRTAGLMITHLLDPIPTEAHVFWSLWAKQPMYVAVVNGGLWGIENGKIRMLERSVSE